MIEIYTDGACVGNPGPGGWAAIIVDDGSKRVLCGGQEETTNNRMEMMAVIKALESLPKSSSITVHSDSQYVVNTMTRSWNRKANQDLWARLDVEAGKRTVEWRWIRGHAGHPFNEEADSYATQEARNISDGSSDDRLSHVDSFGKARMVDVASKSETERVAVARGSLTMRSETLDLIRSNGLKKGDVLGVARIAGIMAAKTTSQLIPLCHPLPLDHVSVEFELDEKRSAVCIESIAATIARTGVEMEALTAVSVAALTVYDMCKSVDRGMRIEGVRLIRKSGGKSGDFAVDK